VKVPEAVLVVAAALGVAAGVPPEPEVKRSPIRPKVSAAECEAASRVQIAIKDRILKASRVLQEDADGSSLWETPRGRYWVPKGFDYNLHFYLAEQERRTYGTGAQAVRPGDIVLDCGANVGAYTREALMEGAKLVVAIEAAPENLACLRRTFAAEVRQGKVIVYGKGVWDKDGSLPLFVGPANSSVDSVAIQQRSAHPGPRVALTPIDKLAAELKLPRVDFIKFDVEGAEQKALAGAQQTLAKFRPRLSVSSYHRPDNVVKIPLLIRKAWPGYRVECGQCTVVNGRIRPDILYFR
jgi:FkbM family methyltransferase